MNKTPMKSFEIIKEMYEYFVKKNRDLEPKLMICEEEDFDNVEKAIKTLDIVKEKITPLFSLDDGEICKGHYRAYDGELYGHSELTREEYDLLKEVLEK